MRTQKFDGTPEAMVKITKKHKKWTDVYGALYTQKLENAYWMSEYIIDTHEGSIHLNQFDFALLLFKDVALHQN